MIPEPSNHLPTLIRALQNPSLYDHPVAIFHVLETHISWVLLTGHYAYKIKKPVNLGFVDFTTLDKRQFFCEEELRLNRRLAPELYLDVATITGTPEAPRFDGAGKVIEYVVKMKEFPQEMLLSSVLEREQLYPAHIDALAIQVADFHGRVEVAGPETSLGTLEVLREPVMDNFRHLPAEASELIGCARIEGIRSWTKQTHIDLAANFRERKARGFIRECHGDLHLGNMALIDDIITIFDCIEFSERLRWIDVMSEIAFVVMDLIDRRRPDLAYRLLNGYLEQTGDYGGLRVMPYYQSYRAMVRAKVAGIRLGQTGGEYPEQECIREELKSYLTLAEQLIQSPQPCLLIMHGLSGSGKTVVSQKVLEDMGGIRIRSDIERKRLFGFTPEARTGSLESPSIYGKDATEATYHRLEELTQEILEARFTVIVDATFLKRTQRDRFRHVAHQMNIPFLILDAWASEAVLKERVKHRMEQGHDASEADVNVLEQQFAHEEPFVQEEQPFVFRINTEEQQFQEHLIVEIKKKLQVA